MWHRRPRPDSLEHAFITGVDQVCMVVEDFDATVAALATKLGIGPFKCWDVRPPALFHRTFRGEDAQWTMRLGVALVGRLQWEVIQPVAGPSLYGEHLAERGEGLHHILLETAGTAHPDAVARLEALGYAHAQTAMLNIPLQLGPLTIPAAPSVLAEPLSTHFGYVDTHAALGTTLELAKFPPGVSRPLGIRIGKPDFFVPERETRVTDSLPNSFIDRVEKLGFIVGDLHATVARWAECGVGPWHIVTLAPESIGQVTFGREAVDFRATVAWTMLGNMLVEVIQPIAGDTPHARRLAERGPGLHYLGVRCDSATIGEAVAHCDAMGCRSLLQGVLFGGHEFALVDAAGLAPLWLEFISLDAEPLYQQLCRLQPAQRYPR